MGRTGRIRASDRTYPALNDLHGQGSRHAGLLEHSDKIHSLTHRLVRDEAQADDHVQSAWLAALQRPPAEQGDLRAWLAIVARGPARRTGRTAQRVVRREALAARREALPSTSNLTNAISAT